MAHETCAACRARVEPVRPSFGSKVAFYAGLAPFVGLVLAYPFGGFLWMFTIPILMLAGLGIGPLVDAAFAPAMCPACDRRFEPLVEPRAERLPQPAPATMLRS